MDLLKLLSASEIIAQVVSFLILLIILRIFAWKPLLKLLDARKERIAVEFKRIEETQAEVEKLRLDYNGRINAIEETANLKIREAMQRGQEIAEETKKKANEEAQRIINSAKEDIKYAVSRAREEVKEQIVDLTIRAAEDVIQEKLTTQQDIKLVHDFLKRIDGLK